MSLMTALFGLADLTIDAPKENLYQFLRQTENVLRIIQEQKSGAQTENQSAAIEETIDLLARTLEAIVAHIPLSALGRENLSRLSNAINNQVFNDGHRHSIIAAFETNFAQCFLEKPQHARHLILVRPRSKNIFMPVVANGVLLHAESLAKKDMPTAFESLGQIYWLLDQEDQKQKCLALFNKYGARYKKPYDHKTNPFLTFLRDAHDDKQAREQVLAHWEKYISGLQVKRRKHGIHTLSTDDGSLRLATAQAIHGTVRSLSRHDPDVALLQAARRSLNSHFGFIVQENPEEAFVLMIAVGNYLYSLGSAAPDGPFKNEAAEFKEEIYELALSLGLAEQNIVTMSDDAPAIHIAENSQRPETIRRALNIVVEQTDRMTNEDIYLSTAESTADRMINIADGTSDKEARRIVLAHVLDGSTKRRDESTLSDLMWILETDPQKTSPIHRRAAKEVTNSCKKPEPENVFSTIATLRRAIPLVEARTAQRMQRQIDKLRQPQPLRDEDKAAFERFLLKAGALAPAA
jgi:hypothetical protein